MATNKPERTIQDAIESSLGESSAGYERTLSQIPDKVKAYVAPNIGNLRVYSYDSVDNLNYESKVQKGDDVLVQFGTGTTAGYAEGIVISETDSFYDDGVGIKIAGHRITVEGWQIKGILKE